MAFLRSADKARYPQLDKLIGGLKSIPSQRKDCNQHLVYFGEASAEQVAKVLSDKYLPEIKVTGYGEAGSRIKPHGYAHTYRYEDIQLRKSFADDFEDVVRKAGKRLDDEIDRMDEIRWPAHGVNSKAVQEFTAAFGAQTQMLNILTLSYILMESKILHELVHVLHYLNINGELQEMGALFEARYYGQILSAKRLGIDHLILDPGD